MLKEITHRDEIHGDVSYDPLAVALLNTPTLQRLGRVYQLGYGHLVYRGATHTRLSHSLGTYATAQRQVEALRRNYESRTRRPRGALPAEEFLPREAARAATEGRAMQLPLQQDPSGAAGALVARWDVLRHLVCWAALLHDVGHVPLGHTLEDEFENIYMRHDHFSSPRLAHLWFGSQTADSEIRAVLGRSELYPESFRELGISDGQDVWAAVLLVCIWKEEVKEERRTSFQDILTATIADEGTSEQGRATAQRLLALIDRVMPWLFAPYMADLVANTISADYLDYLRRDPHNLGLDVLKDDRVVSRFWVGVDHLGQSRMALSLEDGRGKPRLDTCTGVVELVRQRFRFAEIVYYHKTKVAASAMLAKVFQLIGTPPEIPGPRQAPRLEDAERTATRLLGARGATRARALEQLGAELIPTSLLDPEIGDESLPLMLRGNAWRTLGQAITENDRERAADALRAITLLDALTRRELYKVCFSMDSHQFNLLDGGDPSTSSPDGERCLSDLIKRLRDSNENRAAAEQNMVAATRDWPAQSLLLYVPPRKSQAKGILTGALSNGHVVTLGEHPSVKAEVANLSKRYEGLWRLIVLVEPERARDAIGLSDAIDAFLVEQLPDCNLERPSTIAAIEAASWFSYIQRGTRVAARRYAKLNEAAGVSETDWKLLGQAEAMVKGRASDEELADRAMLVRSLVSRGGEDGLRNAMSAFEVPGSLAARLDEARQQLASSLSREGEHDAEGLLGTVEAIDALASELCR